VRPEERKQPGLDGLPDSLGVGGCSQGLPDVRLHRCKGILDAMVQLVDEHPGSNFILFVFGQINQRYEILDDVTAGIANRTDEDSGPELAATALATRPLPTI
jgi:hypothetical protein